MTLETLPPFAISSRPGGLKTARANGIDIGYWRAGKEGAPPLLFLHGLGWDSALWWPFVQRYLERFDVICPDTRGHGVSSKAPGPYSIQLYAADMLAFLDALGLAQVAVVGLSQGGMTAQMMATTAPQRVASLAVLVAGPRTDATSAANMEERIKAQREAGPAAAARIAAKSILSDAFLAHTPGYLEAFIAWRAAMDPACMEAAMRAGNGFDVLPALPKLTMPVVVIAGDGDRLIPAAATRAVAEAIAGAPYIANSGHMVSIEQPAALAATLDPFLERYRRGT